MKLVFAVLAVAFAAASAQQCAQELKGFQECTQTWADNYGKSRPPPPQHQPSNPMVMAGKVVKCFTDNQCESPLDKLMQMMRRIKSSADKEIDTEEEADEDAPEEGLPPPPKGPFSWMTSEKADKIITKFRCGRQMIEKHLKTDIEACIQEKIPGWTCPEPPAENTTTPFDPFAQGKMNCKFTHMWNVARRMKYSPKPEELVRDKRGAYGRHRGHHGRHHGHHGHHGEDGHIWKIMKHKMHMIKAMKLITAEVYNTETCPVDSRKSVGECLSALATEYKEEMCEKKPNMMDKYLRKAEAHDDFCENRQSCFDKISDSCKADFFDQKWYMARCFEQIAETKTDEQWDAMAEDMRTCIGNEMDEDDEESSSSEEDGRSPGEKVKCMLTKKFKSGPIQNPCKKKDGAYEQLFSGGRKPGGPPPMRSPGGPMGGPPPFGGPRGARRGPGGSRRGGPFGPRKGSGPPFA